MDGKPVYPGDLVIMGGGDPSFTTEALEIWVRELARKGVSKIDGRIIGDGQLFPELIASKAWDWGDVGNYYGAPACGLNIDYNGFTATFQPGDEIGAPATLGNLSPEVPDVQIVNLLLTCGETRSSRDTPYVYGGPYSSSLTFRGAIRMGQDQEVVHGSMPDPAFTAAYRLHKILSRQDIEVTGSPTTVRRLEVAGKKETFRERELETLGTTRSEPMLELIRRTHKISDNLYAECLFRLLGLEDDRRDSRKVIEEHWKSHGIVFTGLRLEDGSGLARADLIRPSDLAAVNYAVRNGPHGDAFATTLNEYYEGRVRWKVGFMSRVRAYVGFAGDYTFVLALNNFDASRKQVSEARDKVMAELLALLE